MARPLNQQEEQSIREALAFLSKLLDCLESIQDHGVDKDKIRELRDIIADLTQMLNQGKIDIKSNSSSVQAETDGDGIHLNDQQTMYSLPGDLKLYDCKEGYFASLWTIISVLIHERYHYHYHTGAWGGVKKGLGFVFYTPLAGVADGLHHLFGTGDKRTWLVHEDNAYWHTYEMLSRLSNYLSTVCLRNPDCIPCCDQHKLHLSEARRRQYPLSTYGR